jgi:glucose/arabinose dehydrogenase
MNLRLARYLLLTLLLPVQAFAVDFKLELVAKNLGVPWGMAFLSDEQMIVTERAGQLKLVDLRQGGNQTLSGLPKIAIIGQGGLLDVARGPNYQNDGWIYFSYTKARDNGAVTTLARARLKQTRLVDWQDLLITDSATDTGRHFGSRIAFDDEGFVYFGVGDRGIRDNSQNLSNHAGSIMRLTLDGEVPPDNPFVGQKNKRDEIWSYGHRNPQGLLFDRRKKILWSIEHGPRGGDEINLIRKGRNYGWPVISYGKEYWGPLSVGEGTEKPGMEQPLKVYIPSIAPGSLMLYTGKAFPEWQNSLFAGALKLQHINRVPIMSGNQLGEEERLLEDLNERIRALRQSPQGWIYFSTDSGKIYRLRPVQ